MAEIQKSNAILTLGKSPLGKSIANATFDTFIPSSEHDFERNREASHFIEFPTSIGALCATWRTGDYAKRDCWGHPAQAAQLILNGKELPLEHQENLEIFEAMKARGEAILAANREKREEARARREEFIARMEARRAAEAEKEAKEAIASGEIWNEQYWIVNESGDNISIRLEDIQPDGYCVWIGDNDRRFSVSNDRRSASGIAFDPVENGWEVTGEFDLHAQPFSDAEPENEGPQQ